MPNITCKFLGSFDLPIYTYGTVINTGSWNFQKTSYYAIFCQTRYASNIHSGCIGAVIDAKYGPTRFQFGPQTDPVANLDVFNWFNGKLSAALPFSLGSSSGNQPIYYAENNLSRFIGNNALVTDSYNPQLIYTMPNAGNTTYPASNSTSLGNYHDFYNNIYMFMTISLNRRLAIKNANSGVNLLVDNSFIPTWGGSTTQGGGFIPYNGYFWILNSSLTVGTNVVQTNFSTPGFTNWVATYESPDGVLDFNSIMNASGVQSSMMKSVYGWLFCSLNAITIGGVQYLGYGVLIAPDFSSYLLFRILPQDAGSSTWRTGTVGTPYLKFDMNDYLFLKTANIANKIYYGTIQPQITSYAFGSGIPIASVPHNPGLFK